MRKFGKENSIIEKEKKSLETPEFQEDDHHLNFTSEKGISKEMHKSLFFTTSFKLIELFFVQKDFRTCKTNCRKKMKESLKVK